MNRSEALLPDRDIVIVLVAVIDVIIRILPTVVPVIRAIITHCDNRTIPNSAK